MGVLDFAASVLAASGEGTTHLKLQKLLFYSYAAARVHDEAPFVVPFKNWKHGPVCVEVFEHYKGHQAAPIPVPSVTSPLSGAALDAVRVYGALTAWQLRQESHLEAPWQETSLGQDISDERVVAHFGPKFRGPVFAPRNLPGSWTLSVDGLPALRARTLADLASALGR